MKEKSPVLFLTFNRLEETKKVFEAIKAYKPTKLYISSDGPRENSKADVKNIKSVRDFLFKSIDWDCEVLRQYNEVNKGCKVAVSSAITWFFKHEEKGIILEDDTVPTKDFFDFVNFGLSKYKEDKRVMMITGMNYFSNPNYDKPYFFSETNAIWGWGTWRRAWELYDLEMKLWKSDFIKHHFARKALNWYVKDYYKKTFDSLETTYQDTWDIQWNFCCLVNHGLCMTPSVNLVTNIGVDGTHIDRITDSHFLKTYDINLTEIENYNPVIHKEFWYDEKLHQKKTLKAIIIRRTFKILKSTGIYYPLRFIKRVFHLPIPW